MLCWPLISVLQAVKKPSPSLIARAIKAMGVIWALALLATLAAADGDLVVRHFGSAEGMPVSSATSAQIDADGFLWFSTHDGLARFDGRRFSVFDNMRFPEMGSNRVLRLYAGEQNLVYGVGALGEWLKIDSRDIERLHLDQANPEAKVTFVTRQPRVRAGSALCLTLSTGMYCETPIVDGAPETSFALRRKFPETLAVAAALTDKQNDWLVVPGHGIFYASKTGLALIWANAALKFSNPLNIEAKVGLDGALVIDLSEGLLKLQADGRTRWIEADPSGQIDIVQVQLEADDSVLISTLHESYRIDALGQRTQIQPKQETKDVLQNWSVARTTRPATDQPGSWHSRGGTLYNAGAAVLQSHGEIRDVLFSDTGVVWVSTNRDGVYALSPARVRAVANATLNASNIYGTAMTADGSVWAGSLGAGVFRIASNDQVQNFGEADGLPGLNVWGVAVAPDQTLFAFALSSGLLQLRPGMQRFERLSLPAGLDSASLASISFDHDKKLWLAGSAGAWQQLDPQLGDAGWRKRWPDAVRADLAALKVLTVLEDSDGRMWYGTDQGLFWQQGQQSARIEALFGIAIRGLFRANDGALWVASESKGLSRLPATDLSGAELLRIGRAQGMPSNSPHAIVQDQRSNLWINSNQGIFRLMPNEVEALRSGKAQTVSPMTLGLADGLLELEGNGGVQPAAAVGRDGQIWFPSQRGLVRFNPMQLGPTRKPGRVIIESAVTAGRTMVIDGQQNATLQLPLGAREITIHYNAAELNAGQVRFRYRLDEATRVTAGQNTKPQKAWVDANSLTVASFDAIRPGHHRFEVQAGNADGGWNETPALLEFDVPAHFYETRYFGATLTSLLLLLTGLAVRWRLLRLAHRAQALEQIVQRRTDELSAEKQRVEQTLQALANSHSALSESHLGIASRNQRLAEQATRLEALDRFRTRLLADVSHELRSPLMLVNLPLQELSESRLAAKEKRLVTLAKQQTGRLSHLVEQLVSLVQAEAQQIQLNLRRIALDQLVRQVVAGFEPVNLAVQPRFVVDAEKDLPLIYADAAQITTVLSNFLDNASKYAPASTEVRVSVTLLPEYDSLRVAVQDRGPGFTPELAEALFERFFRAEGPPRAGREGLGVGLALAQELIVLHGGRIGAVSPGSGDDATPNASGACFWFELPLGAAHVALEDLALDANLAESSAVIHGPSSDLACSSSLLLVEDHPELAAYLSERLAEHCPVIVVADAESAWQHLRQNPASTAIVVSDVMLPGRSGIELCQRIKAEAALAHTPVLLISAKAGKADRQSGLDAGAFDWLTKPFSLEALLSSVRRAWPRFGELRAITASALPLGIAPADFAQDRLLTLALARLSEATFGVPEWSERAHLSERQLRRRVTELTGMAPVAWLREQRLLKVRELITNASSRTLAEAGAMAGIDNAGYLYRLYRARFGAD